MLVRVGLNQIFKRNRGRFVGSFLAIGLGITVFFAIAITVDTLNNAFVVQEDYLYGNIDCSVYRQDGVFNSNQNLTIPMDYLEIIKSYEGVVDVVARKGSSMQIISANDYVDNFWFKAFEIDINNPDEQNIGRGIVINCLSEIGAVNETSLEEMLSFSNVSNPLVISNAIANEKGWDVGKEIIIRPQNLTKAYATPTELQAISNGTLTEKEVAQIILSDMDRWERFTIVGVFLDGAEAIEEPRQQKQNSLNTITPNEFTVYFNRNSSVDYVYNQNDETGYFLVSLDESISSPSELLNFLQENPDNITFAVLDIKAVVAEFIDYSVNMVRVFIMILSLLSILVASTLSKSTTEMNLEEEYKIIGILYAMGHKKNRIFEMFLPQVLIISLVGLAIGFGGGFLLAHFYKLDKLIQFLSYNKTYSVQIDIPIVISLLSAVLTIAVGFIFPLVYALMPLSKCAGWVPRKSRWKQLEIQDLLEPENISEDSIKQRALLEYRLKLENEVSRGKWKKLTETETEEMIEKKVKKKMKLQTGAVYYFKNIIVPILIIPLCLILIYYASINIFPQGDLRVSGKDTYIYLGITFLGAFLLVMAILTVFKDIISWLISGLARIFRTLGEIRHFISIRVKAASKQRNRRNLNNTLIVSITLVFSLFTIYASAVDRDVKTVRTSLGGDVVVYDPLISRENMTSILSDFAEIESASLITYDIMEGWDANRNYATNYLINTFDGFGGIGNNITEISNIIILHDIEEYISTNPESEIISDIVEPRNIGYGNLMRKLKVLNTIIIQESLSKKLNKGIGDNIIIETLGLRFSAKIEGIVKLMPACPFMRYKDSDTLKRASILINKDTIISQFNNAIGNVDIMIKNKDVSSFIEDTNDTIDERYYGYTSGLMDKTKLDGVLSTSTDVDSFSYRFSTFAPSVPEVYAAFNSSRIIYQHPNATVNSNGSVELFSRFYAIDPKIEMGISGDLDYIQEVDPWIDTYNLNGIDGNRKYNRNMKEVLYAADNFKYPNNFMSRQSTFGNNCYCVVNRFVAVYEDVNNLDYVYENKVGDVLTLQFQNNSVISTQNFTVIATIGTHLPYLYENGTEKEGIVASWQSLNYDFNENTNDSIFIDIFDVDANVIYTSLEEFAFMEYTSTQSPFGFSSDELINHVYVKVNQEIDVDIAVNNIRASLELEGLSNYSVIALRDSFLNAIGDSGAIHINLKSNVDEYAFVEKLRDWFIVNNMTWRSSSVASVQKSLADNDIFMVDDTFEILQTIGFITLILVQIGLSINISMSIKKQRTDFAIKKALGISNKTIRDMIAVETIIPSMFCVILGFFLGYGMLWIVAQAINTTLSIPFTLVFPIWQTILVFAVSVFSTVLNTMGNIQYILKLEIDKTLNPTSE